MRKRVKYFITNCNNSCISVFVLATCFLEYHYKGMTNILQKVLFLFVTQYSYYWGI